VVIRPNWRYTRRPVVLTDTEFGVAGRLRPRSEVGRVLSVMFAPGMHQHVFVLDRQDALLLRLNSDAYSLEAVNRFVDALGVPVTDFPHIVTRPQPGHVPQLWEPMENFLGYVTPAEFDQEYPGLLSQRELMPTGESRTLTRLFTGVAVLLVIGFAVLVLAMILGEPPAVSRVNP
jgi:hypothetical protein